MVPISPQRLGRFTRVNRVVSTALVAFVLMLSSGCDSEDGPSGAEVDGEFVVQNYTFEQEGGTLVGTVDVLSRIATTNSRPIFTLDLFGQNEDYALIYRIVGDAARSVTTGGFTGASGNRVIIDFGEGNATALRVLLPQRVTLSATSDLNTLTFSKGGHQVTFEQLAELDPSRFGGIGNGTVTGRLSMTLTRL